MRGRQYSSDGTLPERDLYELSDVFAMRLYHKLGRRAYGLTRNDVAEVIRPYTDRSGAGRSTRAPLAGLESAPRRYGDGIFDALDKVC